MDGSVDEVKLKIRWWIQRGLDLLFAGPIGASHDNRLDLPGADLSDLGLRRLRNSVLGSPQIRSVHWIPVDLWYGLKAPARRRKR